MVYLAEFLIVMTDLLKSVRIGARIVPRLHVHKRLDGDATGRLQHQRSTGQSAPTRRSEAF